jgi:hypothetical protein
MCNSNSHSTYYDKLFWKPPSGLKNKGCDAGSSGHDFSLWLENVQNTMIINCGITTTTGFKGIRTNLTYGSYLNMDRILHMDYMRFPWWKKCPSNYTFQFVF